MDAQLFAYLMPFVAGLTQLQKQALPSKWAPIVAAYTGVLLGLGAAVAHVTDAAPGAAVFTGLAAGLAAAGLWAGGQAVVTTITKGTP